RVNRENALNTIIASKNNFWASIQLFFEQRQITGDSKLQDAAFLYQLDEPSLISLFNNCKHQNNPLQPHQARQFATEFIQQHKNAEKQFCYQLKPFGDLEKELQDHARQVGISTICSLPDSMFREFMPL